ncbi:RICIN domain-containing protein [Dactylosporangium sp. CA-152071]|uniref:RICIN domain-containing protein n=1 Tax=Dactylosporangium sp. CA-152071 TaxID=3239933 RepID=UPI003D937BF6
MNHPPEKTAGLRSGASRRRWLVRMLVALGVLTAATLAVPVAAYAGPANPNFLRNWETGRCIQAYTSAAVATQPCNFNNNDQKWRLTMVGQSSDKHHVVKFKNIGTGYCLSYYDYLSGAAQLFLDNCSDPNPNPWGYLSKTWWRLKGSSYDQFEMTWQFMHSKCVDSNYAGHQYIIPCNGGGFQKWRFGY